MSPRRGATCTKRETRVKTWGVRAKISWNVTRNQRRTVFSADDHTRTHTFTRGNVPFFPFFFSTMEKGVERSWQARVKYTSATRKSFNPTKKKNGLSSDALLDRVGCRSTVEEKNLQFSARFQNWGGERVELDELCDFFFWCWAL